MTEPAAVFAAIGDPTRWRILVLLSTGERSVGQLVAELASVSQPAVSQHLRVLHDAELTTVRAEGTRRFHDLDRAGVQAAVARLAALADPLGALANPLDALATEVARGRRAGAASRRAAG